MVLLCELNNMRALLLDVTHLFLALFTDNLSAVQSQFSRTIFNLIYWLKCLLFSLDNRGSMKRSMCIWHLYIDVCIYIGAVGNNCGNEPLRAHDWVYLILYSCWCVGYVWKNAPKQNLLVVLCAARRNVKQTGFLRTKKNQRVQKGKKLDEAVKADGTLSCHGPAVWKGFLDCSLKSNISEPYATWVVNDACHCWSTMHLAMGEGGAWRRHPLVAK